MDVHDRSVLKLEWLSLDQLKPDPGNPKQHGSRQIRQIAKSIQKFGFNAPILIDGNNVILAGHGRVLALQQLAWRRVPVIRIEHLTPAQAAAYAIADNRLAELAVWDEHLLGERFRELSELELDFSLELTGFTMGEIDLRIEQAAPMMRSEDRRDDELPAIEVERRISQPGDLWSLARHKIICGNALDDADYRLLMDRKAQAVFIDPPYNVPIDGHVSGKGSIRHREFAMASGEMDEQAFTAFLTQACGHLARYSANGSLHYICIDWRHLPELLAATRRVYREQTNLCVWVKDNPGMGSHYRSQHELIVLFKNGKKPHRNNVQLGQFGRNRTNVWHYPGTTHFGRRGEESDLLARHPTPKPVALIADALLDCSARGGIVLDAFLGSGSTLIAAERVGRICRGIELDPVYVDLAIRRWERFTGGRAVHAPTGKHFDELAREREACNG
jgi:DNA modification methylase